MGTDLLVKARPLEELRPLTQPTATAEASNAAFFWLSAFFVVYCARPEDWIPGLKYLPLAKITAVFALLALLSAAGKTQRKLRDRPIEANYLIAMISILFLSAILSPVWRGGALVRTLDFSKVAVACALTFMVVTNFERLRRIIFIQAASVAVVAIVSIAKGHSQPRLEGVLGGIYSNPNDLAFAIVLSLPFCLAFLLSAPNPLKKVLWLFSMLVMVSALFLTASRAGFITLAIAGSVCLWHFGVKGRRLYLIAVTLVLGGLIMAVAGKELMDRFGAISGSDSDTTIEGKAYSSVEAREFLMRQAFTTLEHYPILGVGVNNFVSISGDWHEVHMTYLQIAAEGGILGFLFYTLFFLRGFANLRRVRKLPGLDVETTLFVGALHSSLIGFVVGALFAPEAYQYFPYFAVAYTAVLLAILRERKSEPVSPITVSNSPGTRVERYALYPKPAALAPRS